MKPLIGVSSNLVEDDNFFISQGLAARGQNFAAVANDYTDAVFAAGGIPVIIPPTDDEEYLKEVLKRLDGIVLTGGNDLDPALFGERPSSKLGMVIEVRDSSDLFIARYALEKQIPILGICRGLQIINVALGGKLIIDIPSEGYLDHTIVSIAKYKEVHSVKLERNSKIYDAYGKEEIRVNSLHHQGIKELGNGLRCIGWSEDGICEAVELEGNQFVLGTQWHPEMMYSKNEVHLEVFKLFIKACKQ